MIEPSNAERADLPETTAAYLADLETENAELRDALSGLMDWAFGAHPDATNWNSLTTPDAIVVAAKALSK